MFLRRFLLAGLCLFAAAVGNAGDFYAAPNASANGTGSIGNPWKLQTALNHPGAVHAGDTIWLRGGTYNGVFTSYLDGTSANPIIVRQYPGERVTIDGGNSNGTAILVVEGTYTWFWGFEVMSSNTDRITGVAGSAPPGSEIPRGDGIQIKQTAGSGVGVKFINLIIHDARQGISLWKEAINAEVYGCLVYYNGWQGPDRGHGHGVYTQNQTGIKRIVDNIIFEQFGGGIHAYGSGTSFLNNFYIEGNTISENGSLATTGANDNLLVGGDVVTNNDTLLANMLFYNAIGDVPTAAFNFGYNAGCNNGITNNNYVANNTSFGNCSPVAMTGNTFYGSISGFTQGQYPGNTYLSSRPTSVKVFVRPNQYEAGRANITVFNWPIQGTVNVDLTGVLSIGSGYEIRNAQDFFGAPVATGVYAGGSVSVPMTGLPVGSPVGWPTPPATLPEFGAFILTSTLGPYQFYDVPPGNPFRDDISTIAANGITAGCAPGYYCPNAPVTRSQMSVFLLKSDHGSGYIPPTPTGNVFDDVPVNAFAAAWIERLSAEGVTGGCGGNNFCPNASVTRAQMAVFLLKTLLGSTYTPPPATGAVFADVPAGSFAAAWIEDLSARGITAGCGGGYYCPGGVVSRAQMATFLVRTFGF